jgi:electron transfer flavoprotein alpha subunit
MAAAEQGTPSNFERPLRIAALVKQIPVGEAMSLGADGRLVRDGLELEMNAYCRRAVSKGVEWARESGGTCRAFTLGPPSAEDVLREAIAWGADDGAHLCDPAFAGSDTLATARALSAALEREGPFDLILVGRNSLDGDTGQVGPEIAQLLGLPFASGVRTMSLDVERLCLGLELDDGSEEVEVALPALLSVAERLCEPCKMPPPARAEVGAERIRRIQASELGPGPWGQAGSPTTVGATRLVEHERVAKVLSGSPAAQAAEAVALLTARGALALHEPPDAQAVAPTATRPTVDASAPLVAVLIEPDRPLVGNELLAGATDIAERVAGRVVALAPPSAVPALLGRAGADDVLLLDCDWSAEDVAAGVVEWCELQAPWAILGPSTSFGREVLGRAAAALEAGLVGDAIGVAVRDGQLVAAKPAFSGALVADITYLSPIRMVTIRPGVLPRPEREWDGQPTVSTWPVMGRSRVHRLTHQRDDDVEVLARAKAVIGVGSAVQPDEYGDLSALASLLGAELAATRKVTDKGWAPRARQVGITGRSIAPQLYVAIGVSGKFNHVVGVRAAGTIVAINNDVEAPIFGHCDVGLVGDWRDMVPALAEAMRARR